MRKLPRISIAPALRPNRRHRRFRQPARKGEQIIPVRQLYACQKRELVHRSQHPPIRGSSETDGLHGSDFARNGFAWHSEGFEQRADGTTQIRCESGSQAPCREKYREQRTLAGRDDKLRATEADQMDIPVAKPPCRGWRLESHLPRQMETITNQSGTAQRHHLNKTPPQPSLWGPASAFAVVAGP